MKEVYGYDPPLPPCVPKYPHDNVSRGRLRKHAADLKKAERKHREGKCACAKRGGNR